MHSNSACDTVVEGSVRSIGDVVRVTAQLIDAASARVLWSGRFEADPAQLVDLQDDIARGVISELEPELTRAEIALIHRLRPSNVGAWGHYQQGVGAVTLIGWTEEAIREARNKLRMAYQLDPGFAEAEALFALWTVLGSTTGLLPSTSDIVEEARIAAEHALSLDDGNTLVLGFAGCALADIGQLERGAQILLRALEIDPSNAQAHVALGVTYGRMGRSDDSLERMSYGMRISPRDRRLGFWGWALGCRLMKAQRLEEALEETLASARRDPRLHLSRILEAALLLEMGRESEARIAVATARFIRSRLSLQEVAHTHGPRIGARLDALWRDG
ncbi:tetratricopeptide repeat protein [Variovorax sp. J22R24]|uniref:tetratricopeptide repeat protein n=1 Tax=Variovorax gracilis TaxID=3053502 RepID=UPI002575E596|nr:tetratricopeptide repeat protein [Variovorax sp. J22R24]MDM0108121.1 tetratricopeptide repeat protein [Variovorax sp. J22R24]